MRLKFITRSPQPRPAAVAPLNDAPLNDASLNDASLNDASLNDASLHDGQAESARITEGAERPKELGGPSGPEPTRYGDWERKGICVDF